MFVLLMRQAFFLLNVGNIVIVEGNCLSSLAGKSSLKNNTPLRSIAALVRLTMQGFYIAELSNGAQLQW